MKRIEINSRNRYSLEREEYILGMAVAVPSLALGMLAHVLYVIYIGLMIGSSSEPSYALVKILDFYPI